MRGRHCLSGNDACDYQYRTYCFFDVDLAPCKEAGSEIIDIPLEVKAEYDSIRQFAFFGEDN